jgi:hypothetical protein
MKIHVSLRVFWLILIGFFAAIAVLVWFWLVPHGILEYNLAVNVFTSSVFMVLTIVFLNWLFVVREQKEWKTVKSEVYSMVQGELNILFLEILNYTESGLMFKVSLSGLDEKIKKEAYFSELCKLKDAKELKLDPAELESLLKGGPSRVLSDVAQNLSNIELKYSRFLPSNLTFSLIRIQQLMRLLEVQIELHNKLKEISPATRAILPEPMKEEFATAIPKFVSVSFKALIEEIHKMHGMGIELSL